MRASPIIRSRTGCFTCRRRKKKCNEQKPTCSGCKRNKLECHWPAGQVTKAQSKPSPAPRSANSSCDGPSPRRSSDGSDGSVAVTENAGSPASRRYSHASSVRPDWDDVFEVVTGAISPSPSHDAALVDRRDSIESIERRPSLGLLGKDELARMQAVIPLNMTLLPTHDHDSYELLSYYLARTANSMGNGSTDVNPFISKLIPLAFSNPLVLHLILAQSAVHREASNECVLSGEVATRYYTDSLRMFRKVVGEYVSGKDGTNLVVTVGSLILCLTEVARGDVHGTIFDHLTASKSLLTNLLGQSNYSSIAGDLPEFLVEYYMHMLACSMISKDPRTSAEPPLSPNIDAMAKSLLERNYIGQLCGCWLEILVLIPQIFQLGQSMLLEQGEQVVSTSPDNIITFGLLQSQILAFVPPLTASTNSQLAGLVFKQAALLYLWSIFGTPHQKEQYSMHADLMQSAVMEAISILTQIPPSERLNTSLCWPLTVIACCTTDPEAQQVLRSRLQAMIDTIGLGNMHKTLVLLEHVWEQPIEDISPWSLRKVMERHEIWISFA